MLAGIYAWESKLFIELLRHGNRAPVDDRKNFNLTFDSTWGELTTKGIQEAEELGRSFYNEFISSGFLPKVYDESLIYVRSTDLNWTWDNALFVMQSMYPEVEVEFNDLENPQESSNGKLIINIKSEHDYLLQAFWSKVCPATKEMQN